MLLDATKLSVSTFTSFKQGLMFSLPSFLQVPVPPAPSSAPPRNSYKRSPSVASVAGVFEPKRVGPQTPSAVANEASLEEELQLRAKHVKPFLDQVRICKAIVRIFAAGVSMEVCANE